MDASIPMEAKRTEMKITRMRRQRIDRYVEVHDRVVSAVGDVFCLLILK